MSAGTSVFYEPKHVRDLEAFLANNKEKYHEIWIVIIKKSHANPQPVSFNEAVNAAINIGLVDSRIKTLSEEKYAARFTKRKVKKVGSV